MRYLSVILALALPICAVASAAAAKAPAQEASAMLDRAAKVHAGSRAEPLTRTAGRYEPWTPPALSPVPEPAIWAMMIAGLGFTGAALRRTARHPRASVRE